MTTYVRDPFVITNTMRRYNPKTSRYESIVTKKPDPWEGAPKGIRIAYRGLYLDVITNDGYFRRKIESQSNMGFLKLKDDPDPQVEVSAAQRTGWSFPDFDGAPEGFRFYFRDGTNFFVRVITEDGFVYGLYGDAWGKKPGFTPETIAQHLNWYRLFGFNLILVDPEPEDPKPVVHHDTKVDTVINHVAAGEAARGWDDLATHLVAATSYSFTKPNYEPKPGDVIRDKSNHLETWYFTGKHWDKITRCGRVPADEFTLPKRMEIVSRAVN